MKIDGKRIRIFGWKGRLFILFSWFFFLYFFILSLFLSFIFTFIYFFHFSYSSKGLIPLSIVWCVFSGSWKKYEKRVYWWRGMIEKIRFRISMKENNLWKRAPTRWRCWLGRHCNWLEARLEEPFGGEEHLQVGFRTSPSFLL